MYARKLRGAFGLQGDYAAPLSFFHPFNAELTETGLGPFQWAPIGDQGSFGLSILPCKGVERDKGYIHMYISSPYKLAIYMYPHIYIHTYLCSSDPK